MQAGHLHIQNDLFDILRIVEGSPIPSSTVSQFLPFLLRKFNIKKGVFPYFLQTRNVGVVTGRMAWTEIDPLNALAIIVVHADKCTFVANGDQIIPDFQLRGLAEEKTVFVEDAVLLETSKGREYCRSHTMLASIAKTDEGLTLTALEKNPYYNYQTRLLNPTQRIVFWKKGDISFEHNLVYGAGLDNSCGMAIAIRMIQELQDSDLPFLFVFTDNEEGPAAKGHFAIGARELETALRIAKFNGIRYPVITLDGLDTPSKEAINDKGQASIAWQISDGTRGIISQKMALVIQPYIDEGLAKWYLEYTSGSDDWAFDFLMQFRIGVRGGNWHNQDIGLPYANPKDMVKIYGFLMRFLKDHKYLNREYLI